MKKLRVNEPIQRHLFNGDFSIETRFNHHIHKVTFACSFKSLTDSENEHLPVFQLPFECDNKLDFIDLFNSNVTSDYHLCAYDYDNTEFICDDNDEKFALPISAIEKAIKPHLKQIVMNFNNHLLSIQRTFQRNRQNLINS